MNLSVKCKCVLCGHVENVGPQLEHPMCPKCMGPMIPMKAEAQHWNAGKEGTP